jgi:hypothetical protein
LRTVLSYGGLRRSNGDPRQTDFEWRPKAAGGRRPRFTSGVYPRKSLVGQRKTEYSNAGTIGPEPDWMGCAEAEGELATLLPPVNLVWPINSNDG